MSISFVGLKSFVLESIERMRVRGAGLDAVKVLLLLMVCKKKFDLLEAERSIQAREGCIKGLSLDGLCDEQSLGYIVTQIVEGESNSFFSGAIKSIWGEIESVLNSNVSERIELDQLWDAFRCFYFDRFDREEELAKLFEWFLVELA